MSILKNTLMQFLLDNDVDFTKKGCIFEEHDTSCICYCSIEDDYFYSKIFEATVDTMNVEMYNFINCNEIKVESIDEALFHLQYLAPLYDVSPFGCGSDECNDYTFVYINNKLYCMYFYA